jgi:polygalacturonase
MKNVENLWIEGLTVKDPETFGVHLAKVRKFTVRDIVFDCNMKQINEDGVHIRDNSTPVTGNGKIDITKGEFTTK